MKGSLLISSSPFSFDLKVHFLSLLGHIVSPTGFRGEGQSTSYKAFLGQIELGKLNKPPFPLHTRNVNTSEGQRGLLASGHHPESMVTPLLLRSE